MTGLFLFGQVAGYAFADLAKWTIIVCAIIAVVFVICKAMGVAPPPWLVTVVLILVAAFVGIFAVRFLASM